MGIKVSENLRNHFTKNIDEFLSYLDKIDVDIKELSLYHGIVYYYIDWDNRNFIYLYGKLPEYLKAVLNTLQISEMSIDVEKIVTSAIKEGHNSYHSEISNDDLSKDDRRLVELYRMKSLYVFLIKNRNKPVALFSLYYFGEKVDLSSDTLESIENYVESIRSKFSAFLDNYLEAMEQKTKLILLENINTIYNFSLLVNNVKVFDEAYNIIAKEFKNMFGFDHVAVSFINDADQTISIPNFDKATSQKYLKEIEQFKESVSGITIGQDIIPYRIDISSICYCGLNNTPVYIKNVQDYKGIYYSEFDKKYGEILFPDLKTNLLIPLSLDEKPIGVLLLHSANEIVEITKNELDIIKTLSGFISSAINNAKLFQEAKQKNEELEELNKITKQISRSLDVKNIFYNIFNYLSSTYDFNGTHLNLVTQDKKKYIVETVIYPAELKHLEKEFQGKVFHLNETGGRVSQCINENKIFYFTNVVPLEIEDNVNRVAVEKLKIKSAIHMPIDIGGEVIGSFFMTSHFKTIYLNESDIESVKRFVNQIAILIRNSKFYKEIKSKKEEIENLNSITKQMNSSLDLDEVFNQIFNYLNQTYEFEGCGLILVTKDKKNYVFDKYYLPEYLSDVAEQTLDIIFPLDIVKGGTAAKCILNNEILFFPDIDPNKIDNELNREAIKIARIKTALHIPISAENEVLGEFLLTSHSKPTYLSQEDIDSIKRFVNQIASIVRNSKLYDEIVSARNQLLQKDRIMAEDLLLAKRIQTSLIDFEKPKMKGLNIESVYRPMIEVGGDLYDISKIKDNYYRFFIADATGHGVQAALTTMIIKTEYDKIKTIDSMPNIVLSVFNDTFINNYYNLNVFFTCAILDVDLNRNKIFYSSAGHSEQVIINSGKTQILHCSGKLVGALKDLEYKRISYDFNPGDKLLLFTDGLFEEFDEQGNEFEWEAVFEIIKSNTNLSVSKISKKILKSVENHSKEITDDITLIGIECKNKK